MSGNGARSSKTSTKKITTAAKEIKKETKSVPITVELNILKVLINERLLIPLFRILKKNKELHTRELLMSILQVACIEFQNNIWILVLYSVVNIL